MDALALVLVCAVAFWWTERVRRRCQGAEHWLRLIPERPRVERARSDREVPGTGSGPDRRGGR
jgi:hypothetical protein